MKHIEKYLERVLKIKPLGTITTERDVLNKELYGERIYVDGIDTGIFIAYVDYLSWVESNCILVSEGRQKVQPESAMEAIKEEKVDNVNKVEPKDYSSIDPYFGKPIDKVEPKFKVGDWIVHQGTENIYQVVTFIDNYNQYVLKYGDNYTIQKCANVDKYTRLWDITKDAKKGDILIDNCDDYEVPLIFILKRFERVNFGLVKPSDYSSYCFLTASNNKDNQRFKLGHYHHMHNIEPATKEQRDLLFSKMKEAGYKLDKDFNLIKI